MAKIETVRIAMEFICPIMPVALLAKAEVKTLKELTV